MKLRHTLTTGTLSLVVALLASTPVFASATNGTIDTINRYAWSENGGWIDFGSTEGVVGVSDSALTGYAWSENFGWISFNCSNSSTCGTVDFGVTNSDGTLGGYAWSENVGWIDFDPTYGGVSISSSGVFSGYAWGENIGWIVFNCSNESSCGTVNYTITTDWRPSSARTSASTSTTTQRSGGTRASTLQNRMAGATTTIDRHAAPSSAPDLTTEDQQEESLRQRAALEQKLYVKVNGSMVMYSDVPLAAWFTPYITKLIEWGVAEGYRDERGELTGIFGVANPVTRAEALKMSLHIAGREQAADALPENASAQGTWAASYIAMAEKMGLSVFTKTTDVHAPATRGEVVQIILEALKLPMKPDVRTDFSDVPSNSPFAAAIATAFDLKIIQGDTDGEGNLLKTFRPNDPINRAEVAKIISLARETMNVR